MQLRARLVHAEAGRRVVQVSAWQGGECLGSALGEADTAEQAEERAQARLQQRLGSAVGMAGPEPLPPPRRAAAIRRLGSEPAGTDVEAGSDAAAAGAATPAASQTAAAPDTPDTPDTPGDPLQPALDLQAAPLPPGAATAVTPASLLPGASSASTPSPARPGGSPSSAPPAPAPGPAAEPPSDPDDWSDELAAIDLQLQRLGWAREQEGLYLERAFGHPSRSRLTTYRDLRAYLQALAQCSPGSDPANAPVPLRRRELLAQCDALLRQLGWEAAQGRRFLEQQFQLASRLQLSDEQLLHFNMLLESELLRRDPPLAAGQEPAGEGAST